MTRANVKISVKSAREQNLLLHFHLLHQSALFAKIVNDLNSSFTNKFVVKKLFRCFVHNDKVINSLLLTG